MICHFFVRRGDMLRVEVRADEGAHAFVLVVKEGNGRQRCEEFADAESLRQGLARLRVRLDDEQWVPAGLPIEVPDVAADRRRKTIWHRASAVVRKLFVIRRHV